MIRKTIRRNVPRRFSSTERLSLRDASFWLRILEQMESIRVSRENLNLIMDKIIQNFKLYSKTEEGHGGKVQAIIYRQGRSRDWWLARNWRRNREAVCIRRRSSRIYL